MPRNADSLTAEAPPGHVGSHDGLGVVLGKTWRSLMPGRFDDEAHLNLLGAIPAYPRRAMSTMEIWHDCELPKPTYSRARQWLRELAEGNLGCERTGGPNGAQFYRWMD